MDQSLSIIELKNVSLRRGGKTVLDGISWSTRAGQHWFILGDNGSGKTSLLEVLAGYLWPQKGRVAVLGRRYGEVCLPDLRRHIGYVSSWVFEHLHKTSEVERVVASGLEASVYFEDPWTAALKRRVERHLEELGCRDLAGRKFGELSSGEQFKVVIARSLVSRPALLILDEPFAFMDIGSRAKAYRMVEHVARATAAPQIVLVTHHFEDILPLFTHGLVLRKGKIISKGVRQRVLHRTNLQRIFDFAP